jgi:hypothetical protein
VTPSRKSNTISWGPRPIEGAMGFRPTPGGVDVMIGRQGEPVEFIAMSIREARALAQALNQAIGGRS